MAKIMLIDGNNIGYASQHTNKLHIAGREVQAIFQFVKTTRSLLSEHRGYLPLILWDSRAQFRFELCPDYKGNRNKDPKQAAEKEKYEEQKPDIERALKALGVRQLLVQGYEADDMAGYLTKQAANSGDEILLISGDKDWMQLVDKHCVWHDPIRDITVSNSNFAEITGFASPDQFVEGKALMGDSSDNIKGVGGIGAKGAEDFLFEYGSVKEFLIAAKKGELSEKLPAGQQRFIDNKPFEYRGAKYPPMIQSFKRNMRLMDLRNVPKPVSEDVIVTPAKLDEDKFREFAEELAFHSILKTFDTWITPFH